MKLLIKNGLIYIDHAFKPYDIGINEDKICEINTELPVQDYDSIIDASNLYVMPGGIDTHTHIRAPGCDRRETFKSGTLAAAAGGTTLIVEQPICTYTPYNAENLSIRIQAAEKEAIVDFAFYGAAGWEYPDAIKALSNEGVVGYKTFLSTPPACRENEFVNLYADTDYRLLKTMEAVAQTGKLHMFHAENHNIIAGLEQELSQNGTITGKAHALSRPPYTEELAVLKLLHFARITHSRLFFAHISSPKSIEAILKAQEEGVEAYIETCIHYLTLTDEALNTYGPFAKCNPPMRDQDTQDALWAHIRAHHIDCIGSDHSPFLYDEKHNHLHNIFHAPAGLVGIDLRQPLLIDAALNGKISLEDMAWISSERPAEILGLNAHKGSIKIGMDADFCIFSTTDSTLIDKNESYSHSKDAQIVYDQKCLKGRILYTILRGHIIMQDGKVNPKLCGLGELITN